MSPTPVPTFRRCALSRAVLPKTQMVRFVVSRNRVLTADLRERLPGRGIWLNAEGDMLEAAQTHGELSRVVGRRAGANVVIPSDLRGRLVAGLTERIAELIVAARRAGQTTADTESIKARYGTERRILVLVATDATEHERECFPGAVDAGLSRAALGTVFGSSSLTHVGVSCGRLAVAIKGAGSRRKGLAAKDRVTETV